MRQRWFPATIVALAAVLAGGCRKERELQKTPRPVRAETVGPYAVEQRIRYSANIEPREQVALAFKVNGYISEIKQVRGVDGRARNLQEGDRVTRGTVLAQVREDDYVEAVNLSRGSLGQAEAALQKTTLDYERAKRLLASDSLTKTDYDSAKAAYDAALAQRDASRASLAESEIRLRDTSLVAPADGVILSRSIEVGSLVGAGSLGFTMADTSSVKAVFGVPDTLMRRARLGASLPVTTEVYGTRQFPGRITAIAPSADPTSRVFEVELTIANPQTLLKPGMIATVAVPNEDEAGSAKLALVVPLNAIVRPQATEGYSVFVVVEQGGKQLARRRAVTIGEVYGNMIAVTQGVNQGERVIMSGAGLVADGEEVRVIP